MPSIPKTQTAAIVRRQGDPVKAVEFDDNYPVPEPGENEVLVKVLYTGVCQSDLHTAAGTATGADGLPITNIKLPHVGGHEGVGRVVKVGTGAANTSGGKVDIGTLVGIRFLSRICHTCEYCTSGREQHCQDATNHLHHEDGSFQEYCVLDSTYLTVLPDDIDLAAAAPTLCAGLTAYKAVLNANLAKDNWLVIVGAGGGLGHYAVQYGLALGAKVLGVDTGKTKKQFIESLGGRFLDFAESSDLVADVVSITSGGAHAAIVTSGNPKAFKSAADMLRINGTLCCIGIPPGDAVLTTPIATIVIKGLRVVGNLVGSMKETMEAVELVRTGAVKPHVEVRPFRELPRIYEMLEKGDILGRVVLQVGKDGAAQSRL